MWLETGTRGPSTICSLSLLSDLCSSLCKKAFSMLWQQGHSLLANLRGKRVFFPPAPIKYVGMDQSVLGQVTCHLLVQSLQQRSHRVMIGLVQAMSHTYTGVHHRTVLCWQQQCSRTLSVDLFTMPQDYLGRVCS